MIKKMNRLLVFYIFAAFMFSTSLTVAKECVKTPMYCAELVRNKTFCTDEGNIAAKSLAIEGQISSEIGKFTSAVIVDFSFNILTGKIPEEIGSLKHLTRLGLKENYLTGTIPETVYSLPNLKSLGLGELPGLTGNLSSAIGRLQYLQDVQIFGTKIRGTIPTEFGSMKSLLWLQLQNNELSGTIPTEITSLTELRWLDFRGNKKLCNPGIAFDPPFAGLRSVPLCPGVLTYGSPVPRVKGTLVLNKTSCRITGCENGLGLKCNENTGYCEMENIFGEEYSTKTRVISKPICGLTGAISRRVCELKSLERIELRQNDISGDLPECIFNLTELTHLSVGINKIGGSIPDSIGRLEKLTHLDLGNCELKGTIPKSIGRLVKLTYLDIQQNGLSGSLPCEIGNLVNLKFFDMNKNRRFGGKSGSLAAAGPLPSQIGNLVKLSELIISDVNFLGDIPTQLGKLTNLVDLELSGSWDNMPSGLPSELGLLRNLTRLKLGFLWVLSQLPSELGLLTGLTYLDAHQARMNGSIPTEIANLNNLQHLDLEGNFFTGVLPSEIGSMSNLRNLVVAGNQLDNKLPTALGRARSLNKIDVRNNNFSGRIPSQLGLINTLKVLFLGSNGFSGQIPAELGNLQLYQVDLANITNLSGSLPQEIGNWRDLIGILRINANISGSIPYTLGNLAKVDILDLSNNSLTGEIPTALGGMESLKELSLRDNLLQGEMPSSIVSLNTLQKLEIGNNPLTWVCDCKLLNWYGTSVKKLEHYDSADVIGCSALNEYKGSPVHILRSDERAPCSHAELLSNSSAEPNSITFEWKYSTWTSSGIYESEFKKSIPRIVTIHQKFRNHVRSCRAFSIQNNEAEPSVKFGFELSVNQGEHNVYRECFIADDVHRGPNKFSFTVRNLTAFQKYKGSVRAIFFQYELIDSATQRISYVFGPRSRLLEMETLPSTPGIPVNVSSGSTGDRQLLIQWSKPLQPNGRILRYYIEIEAEGGVTRTYNTADTFKDIQGAELKPDSKYTVRVQAETIAGKGGWSYPPIEVVTCPANMRRVDSGECFSRTGYFQTSSVKTRECEDILKFITEDSCLVDGLTTQTLLIKNGFWRESLNSEYIRRCPNTAFCQQSSPDNTTSNQYCTDKHTGVYCQLCVEPYVLVPGEGCVECTEEDASKATITLVVYWFILAFCFAAMVVVLVLISKVKNEAKRKSEGKAKYACGKTVQLVSGVIFGSKLRILFGFFQVFMGFADTFLFRAVQQSTRSSLNLMFNFNLGEILSVVAINCAWDLSHYDILLIYTLFPMFFLLILKVVKVILKRTKTGRKRYNVTRYWEYARMVILTIMFFIYPGVSRAIFATFDCENFELADGKSIPKSALRADYHLECDQSAERAFMLVFASLMVLVYPVGILVVYSKVLGVFPKDKKGSANADNEYNSRKTFTLLTYPYKGEFYWYELFELSRKLIQIVPALIVFSMDQENYVMGALASLIVSIVYLCVAFKLEAYKSGIDFCFAIISLGSLTALCLLVIFAEVSYEEDVNVEVGIGVIVLLEILSYVLLSFVSVAKVLKEKNLDKKSCIVSDDMLHTEESSRVANNDVDNFIQKVNSDLETLCNERQSRQLSYIQQSNNESDLKVMQT